jgi:predicted helicase
MSDLDIERLRSIKSFPSLVKYLRDELDWPIASEDFDELTFDYEPEELGLDAKTAVKIKEIKQLRPLASNQPWGIFFVNFEPKRLPVVVLRRILRSLVIKKRQSANKPQQAAWQLHDLLFISAYGESEHRDITLANFSEGDDKGDLPTLKVLGWDDEDTARHLAYSHEILKEKLHWPDNPADLANWRQTWSQAFTLKHREVIGTSKQMAEQMAELATAIRKRVNNVLAVESEKGPMRKLMTAFREALIHDLKPDDFADMYAQTITYGLLSARVSRPAGLVADNIRDMVPITNPFLRDLLSTFLTVGGRRGKVDFDELGINDVVQALRDANMAAVVRDFDDKNPDEDPVIHFYELFLKEYDPKKRMQRGVFFTPRPVVSFIVRSVDEILRKEFGLADGLADTTTWGEMAKRHREIKIPDGAKPEDPFVQILDPACGTGTFLVEAIDLIHQTMMFKWRKQGHIALDLLKNLWNEYVSDYLLPRLYGFELMMAPYAIAHMKIGLKLGETGYSFRSHERARIYLTNTLEPPLDFSEQLELDAPPLAHEAQAVNAVKRHKRFTVVIGNPPYSGQSVNEGEWIRTLVQSYYFVDGQPLGESNPKWLLDDYVKFIRLAQKEISCSGYGIAGLITNHAYLDNPTFRGLRWSLQHTFNLLWILDLHGNMKKKEHQSDGSIDANVFDIQQGVAISVVVRAIVPNRHVVYSGDLLGDRNDKYDFLTRGTINGVSKSRLNPDKPFFLFVPQNTTFRAEYDQFTKITEMMPVHSNGIVTARDHLCVNWSREGAWEKVRAFSVLPPEKAREQFELGEDSRDWQVKLAQKDLRADGLRREALKLIYYRPFDNRWTYYTGRSRGFLCMPRPETMRNMLSGGNLALITSRMTKGESFQHAQVTRNISEAIVMSPKTSNNGFLFPLYIGSDKDQEDLLGASVCRERANFSKPSLSKLSELMRIASAERAGIPLGLTAEDIFCFIYAVLHSPSYRSRYAEFLKIDFPRLPLTSSLELFRALAKLGGELVALHLMESPKLAKYITKYAGKGDSEVAKGYPKFVSGGEAALDCGREAAALGSNGKPGIAVDGAARDSTRDSTRNSTNQSGSFAAAVQSASRVYINPKRWFDGVPENVWNFHIGGYQVCEKWLKDRRGRVLSEEDIAHYQKIVVALKETIRLMAEIDQVIEAHGGWPTAFTN